MKHAIPPRPLAALIYLTLSAPLMAAQPPAAETSNPPSTTSASVPAGAATVCRDDIKAL
jgi:hypothetical protein